jgi:CRISPR/Cas system-associated exonuclease Cas4 (RecB family)
MPSITATQVLEDIKRGALGMNQVPCSICREKKPLPRLHFHGSDWGKCIRDVQFEMISGHKPTTEGEDALRLNDGHLHEALVLKSLQMGGHTITHRDTKDGEIIVVDDVVLPMGGSMKILTCGHTDGVMDGDYVVECKAVKDWAWKNKFLKGLIPSVYYGQCQFYMHAHDKDLTFLIVKHRHTSEILVFEIKRSPEYIAQKRIELAAVLTAVQHAKTIRIPKDWPDDECRFCDFHNQCWGGKK